MQILRFGIVGIINTFMDFAILNGLLFLAGYPHGPGLVFFNCTAFLFASLNSFLMNKNWTFNHRCPGSVNQFVWFLGFTLAGMSINSLLVFLLTTPLASPANLPPVIWVNTAKAIATLASMIWNYATYRKFVFGRLVRS